MSVLKSGDSVSKLVLKNNRSMPDTTKPTTIRNMNPIPRLETSFISLFDWFLRLRFRFLGDIERREVPVKDGSIAVINHL